MMNLKNGLLELAPADFRRVLPIFAGFQHASAVRPVVEGICHGRVFVDDLDEPNVGLVWESSTFYLASRPNTVPPRDLAAIAGGLGRLVETEFLPKLGPWGGRFAYWPEEAWEPALMEMLAPFGVNKWMRCFYSLCPSDYQPPQDWRAAVPRGCAVRQVTPELLADSTVEKSSLRHELGIMWAELDRFFEHAFGYCLVRDGKVLSWCLTEYPNGDQRGIGIETDEEHLRQRYGWMVASACLEHAFSKGLTIHWDSWANNTASVGLAEKLGFELTRRYPVLAFRKTP